MKKSFVLIVLLGMILVGCNDQNRRRGGGTSLDKKGGGVDVGNMTGETPTNPGPLEMRQSQVPGTKVVLTYPNTWSSKTNNENLTIESENGSVVQAEADHLELSSPTPEGLRVYLSAQYPEKNIQAYSTAGLEGVRTTGGSDDNKSEMWLIGPNLGIVKITSAFSSNSQDQKEGEEILNSARVKYLGKPYINEPVRSAELEEYFLPGKNERYSIIENCFVGVQRPCGGEFIEYMSDENRNQIQIDRGRIIDLGPSEKVDFDSVRVEGEYLISPKGKVPVSDIYTVFKTTDPSVTQEEMEVQKGHVYLIRTKDWPNSDVVTKLVVDEMDVKRSIQFRYQKLTYIETEVLEQQLNDLIEYNRLYEMPRDTGEVVLFNRSFWYDYDHANFNFQFATSGNHEITNNHWNLQFAGESFHVPMVGGEFALVEDLGAVDLMSVQVGDFTNPNTVFTRHNDHQKVILGHTYLVTHLSENRVLGAVRVLEIGPGNLWVRLQFRRLVVEELDEFQIWTPQQISSEIQDIELSNQSQSFNPYGDPNDYRRARPYFTNFGKGWEVRLSERPYESKNGIRRIKKPGGLLAVTVEDFDSSKGEFSGFSEELHLGDVILAHWMGIYEKELFAMEVVEMSEDKIKIRWKRIYSAKASIHKDDEFPY